MAKWFHALEIATGAWTWMCAGDDQDAPGGYDPAQWTFTPIEGEPTDLDTWDGSAVVPDVAKLKDAKRDEINARLGQAFLGGYKPPAGALAGSTLQLRDDQDRTNWLASAQAYGAAIAAGYGAVAQAAFRTQENETITLTFSEGFQVLLDMQKWGGALMACCWRLKDALAATDDPSTIDVESETW